MNTARLFLAAGAVALLLTPGLVGEERLLSSPGFSASRVADDGTVHEEWGTFGLRLCKPDGAEPGGGGYSARPVPVALTSCAAGQVTLTQTAYRAPIWPSGVDVVLAQVTNRSDAATPIGLEVSLPENAAMSDSAVMLGNRAIVALPKGVQPLRRERSWGCASGGEPLPGWARPKSPCDPAFGNIRAGMGGVPLIYRFAVPAGEERTVVLGFCESHWTSAGQRPLEIYVEGAAKSDIDPIARWGRHGPGCLRFAARDANSDGRLQVVIAPHPNAADKNTILNVLWVFMPDIYVDPDEVQIGKAPEAEYHVDVGGETDQLLYDGSKLSYEFQLEAGGRRELLFLLASPGARSVPDPQTMAWTSDSLRQAAEEVWAGQRE